ncbi:MAG: DUF4249 domain-containing protein [Flavobacteriaceae bacterium]|nr:DUF4249 domain-containing protein [Flavobacteriaceae bacterium]
MKNFKTLFLVFVIFLTSCEDFFITEIEPPKEAVERQLVVHSYLSPNNDEIEVSVKYSKPIFSNNDEDKKDKIYTEDEQIKGAKVLITNESTGQKATVPFDALKRKYVLKIGKFPLKEKETYKLNVSFDGKNVEAFSTIPEKIDTEIRNIKLKKIENRYEDYKLETSFDFDDKAGQENYYIAFAKVKYLIKNKNPRIDHGEKEYYEYIALFTDANSDGKTIHTKIVDYMYSSRDIKSVEVSVLSLNKETYDYLKTVKMQIDNNDGNPFKEPTIIVSNIKGGLGVFGAYTVKKAEKFLSH